jgi:hypothetical protein
MVRLKPCMMRKFVTVMVLHTISICGLDGAATAGDKFNIFEDEKKQNKLLLNVLN